MKNTSVSAEVFDKIYIAAKKNLCHNEKTSLVQYKEKPLTYLNWY